jgi:hypothetical protein
LIITDKAYVDSGTGYINNLNKRLGYRIEIEVFDNDTESSLGPRISANPDLSGQVKISVSGVVSAYLSANWTQPSVYAIEPETSRKIFIKIQEYYDGVYRDIVSDIGNPTGCVFAMINLLLVSPPDFTRYAYGGNMNPFNLGIPSTHKWMTRFNAPSAWRGWPFTVSFLNQGYANVKRRVIFYDSTGTLISSDGTDMSLPSDGIYRMDLPAIPASAVEANLSIEDPGGDPLSSTITVKIKDPCPAQLLLFWKNSLGGDAIWMFDESQEYKYSYPSGRKVTRMKLYSDNLVIGEWDAINELNSATDVMASNLTDYGMDNSVDKTHFRNDNQVFIINQNGEKVGVIVIETENMTKTMYKKHAVEITIELPELFTV